MLAGKRSDSPASTRDEGAERRRRGAVGVHDIMFYRVCGLRLRSNVPLPELLHADESEVDCRFDLRPARPARGTPGRWLQQWYLPDGQVWLSLTRHEAGFLLRFP